MAPKVVSVNDVIRAMSKGDITVTKPTDPALKNSSSASNAELEKELLNHGIHAGKSERKYQELVLGMVKDDMFWVRNYSLHPNAHRVRGWIRRHDRFRACMREMVKMIARIPDTASTARAQLAYNLGAKFNAFLTELDDHGNFEDAELFKYFIDNIDGCWEDFEELEAQHADHSMTDQIVHRLEKLIAAQGNVSQAELVELQYNFYLFYRGSLAHLALEEKMILQKWLNLTPQEYRHFRSYLSWKHILTYYKFFKLL
ncbi:hypothetical protein SPRG_08339 [Saprolegnia parasitica CBS 223.65]|uniref:Uncharacterized protein n=1 Tax=Saprolegnia parasitica (strain CBS 223.65) TaxID=695850 RepID=A0A067C703_SAPPC|nr:hypothetical protein SPRG_08339 [Saprolegnia parasitica CBS 223.65]KDO26263.1 hypothetical protein SPRG_08339 [Saprolegnia parasitica CBS 223.65]|eukprot:XP_012202972.1 hypothetical protein SPRG_08339 [Saprolegnia parasitica CBS 223.65]